MRSYRPNYDSGSYNNLPPKSPQAMPPLPRGPPPVNGMYQFGTDARGAYSENLNSRQVNDFSFHNNSVAPQYLHSSDLYPPTYGPRDRVPTGPRHFRENGGNQRGNQRGNRSRPSRGVGQRVATANRPLLKFQRGSTPEQMLGMINDQSAENRFMNADDLSDSAEEVMDEYDTDQREPDNGVAVPTDLGLSKVIDDATETRTLEAPFKEALHEESMNKTVDLAIPKWSNPEYYTALPPPDESQRRKKDVVKLIRKARLAVPKDSNTQSQVATNADFISFNFGNDPDPNDHDSNSEIEEVIPGFQGPSAALQPSNFSHLHNFNRRDVDRPPEEGTSASALKKPISALENPDGNRKRKRAQEGFSEDEISIPRPPKRKKGLGRPSDGNIAQEWVPLRSQNSVPWVVHHISSTGAPGFRLHKEICDFYEFVKPQNYEQVIREDLLQRLQIAVRNFDSQSTLYCFGSFAAGLYLPTADMDLVMISQTFRKTGRPYVCQTHHNMHRLGQHLSENGIADPSTLEIVASAKVPIIKFVDVATSLRVDMSFENETGVIANNTFSAWKAMFPAMPVIVTVIKQFLMMRELNEVASGGLGGFSITCLVTSLLQNMPQIQTGELRPEHHLGEILLEFLDLYGNQLDISRTGISMKPPGYINKLRYFPYTQRNKASRLAIIDPNKADNDISGGSKNVMLIFQRFSRAREEILSAMHSSSGQSLLEWMLGGNYNNFLWQRQRLRKLYKEKYGSVGGEVAQSNLADLSIEKVALGQYNINDLSDIPSSPSPTISRSQHAPPDVGSSNLSWNMSAQLKQAPAGRSLAPKPTSKSSKSRREARRKKGVDKNAFKEVVAKIRKVNKKINEQNAEKSEKMSTELIKLDQQLDKFRSDMVKIEYPDLATLVAVPPTLSIRQRDDLLSFYRKIKAGGSDPAFGLDEKGSSVTLANASPSGKKMMRRQRASDERSRSRSFKNSHPEIAAIVDIPLRLDKATEQHLLAQHKTQEIVCQSAQTKPVSMQNSSSEQLISQNEKGGLSTMALHHDDGNAMDNPISID